MSKQSKIWKIRNVKNYPGAHNHITVGRVLEKNAVFVRVFGRTFHFGKNVMTLSDIKCGPEGVRLVPWNRIEVVNELPEDFDFSNAELCMDEAAAVVLKTPHYATSFTSSYEKSL